VSKNVAVFVDVANIFYAAKAAGVDIDYVTLLKSATAGRDFVRAYAYTGLDPDNDNQRNFHEFLKRSGYKVVSKDIRKYGDGRIKANLDIELVVDLMRLSQHIDIAVVISGDGDFAPAIRAVQQMGVRVEVISFKGNTSSDLIEVADDFYDITNIARVEKGARSGRRVAAEDDLSMTAVPEKETDNGPRRRRGGTGRRDGREDREGREGRGEGRRSRVDVAVAAVADSALPGNVIVLPGERLSRAASAAAEEMELDEELLDTAEMPAGDAGEPGQEGEGRRRRRRRGGRGRGRGRRPEGEEEGEEAAIAAVAGVEPAATEEDEFLEEELPTLPQHSTFGSVWDTQIGLPSQPISTAGADEDEEYDDEPEIPEYLLAERRQQGRGNRGQRGGRQGGGGRGGRQGGYQSAIDRERYGRSGSSMFGSQSGGQRSGGGQGGQRSGGGQGGQRSGGGSQQSRRPAQPQAAPRDRDRDVAPVTGSAEPWSEVPPEVQELLRAELARRSAGSGKTQAAPAKGSTGSASGGRSGGRSARPQAAATEAPAEAPAAEAPAAEAPAAEAAPKPARRRTTKAAATEAPAEAPAAEAPAVEAAPKPARKRTTKATTEATEG
jgi:uncharacterized LabA/DUF88 family protein